MARSGSRPHWFRAPSIGERSDSVTSSPKTALPLLRTACRCHIAPSVLRTIRIAHTEIGAGHSNVEGSMTPGLDSGTVVLRVAGVPGDDLVYHFDG